MINKDISSYSSIFSKDYTELRFQENRSINITLLNGDIVSNDSSAKSGVSSRTFKDGNWGFSSNPNISDDAVQSVIKSSTDNVKFLNKIWTNNHHTTQSKIFKTTGWQNYNIRKKRKLTEYKIINF